MPFIFSLKNILFVFLGYYPWNKNIKSTSKHKIKVSDEGRKEFINSIAFFLFYSSKKLLLHQLLLKLNNSIL